MDALHGEDMRKCWVAAEGCRQLGIDASAIEARALAFEIDCEDTINEIIHGDIHQKIMDTIPEFSATRGSTKAKEYALFYGASDLKLGSMVDVDGCFDQFASVDKLYLRGWVQDPDGKWRHKKWSPKKESLTFKEAKETVCGSILRLRIMVGLKPLGDAIEKFVNLADKGYLVSLDGRKLQCRSSHSAFNLRLQSTGAIICKTALVLMMNELEKQGYVVVGKDHDCLKHVEMYSYVHDEFQMGVPEHFFTDKIVNVDFKEFDLTVKADKKLASEKATNAVKRFVVRELRNHRKHWSKPVIDFKNGTVKITHSVIGDIATEAFFNAGHINSFDIPVESEQIVGKNWADCH